MSPFLSPLLSAPAASIASNSAWFASHRCLSTSCFLAHTPAARMTLNHSSLSSSCCALRTRALGSAERAKMPARCVPKTPGSSSPCSQVRTIWSLPFGRASQSSRSICVYSGMGAGGSSTNSSVMTLPTLPASAIKSAYISSADSMEGSQNTSRVLRSRSWRGSPPSCITSSRMTLSSSKRGAMRYTLCPTVSEYFMSLA
mmetsp:Transcript_876/g.2178  ORF Transcript_876/g.2178 Transcript_876/m.2178 type:complete len:200 (-) Transcript_876:557-1156(-)